MSSSDLYHAHLLVNRDGKTTRHPAGRFFVKDGDLHHLEDYHGLLRDNVPAGPVDEVTQKFIREPSPGLEIASHRDIAVGRRPDFIKEHPLDQPLPKQPATTAGMPAPPIKLPPSVFHYTRVGHDKPHVLEVREGRYLLDGNPLADHEISTIMDNVKTRAAQLRYAKSGPSRAITKMERAFETMRKEEMGPQEALAHLDTVGSDEKTRGAIAALRKHLFEDPMNPGVGNKFAYEQFRAKNQPGIWTSADVNDLKHVNDVHGHTAGDDLIRAFGGAARRAVDPAAGKLFRAGGDEYVMWHPDRQSAHLALRNLRSEVDQLPPINGVHRVSFSAGLGSDFDAADQALLAAKSRKKLPTGQPAFAPGTAPHLLHSSIKGAEGPIPLDQDSPPRLPEEPQEPKLQSV